MVAFSFQIETAKAAHRAVNLIEEAAQDSVREVFRDWATGKLNNFTVRFALERVVREAYRSSAAIAAIQIQRQADLPGWEPVVPHTTPYLASLLRDARRNSSEAVRSNKDPLTVQRSTLRAGLSAGVAAQRGYTDALVAAAEELASAGFEVRKVWTANTVNHTPCPQCLELHGSEVGLKEDFPMLPGKRAYLNLVGPPAHPNCQCWLTMVVTGVDNVLDTFDPEEFGVVEDPAESMLASFIRALPLKAFLALVKFLTKLLTRVTRLGL